MGQDNTTDPIRVDARLDALEIKASFTEDLVEQLNEIISRQQQDLELLARHMRQLKEQLAEPRESAQGGSDARDNLPPHY